MCSEEVRALTRQVQMTNWPLKTLLNNNKNASVFVSAPPLLHPLHMFGINLTSIFLQAEQKPSRTYTVSTANWFWMPVRNTNPMAKIGPWKLDCAHTNHLSPLGPCHSPDLLAAAPLGCSLRLAKQALLYGLLPSCVCMCVCQCVCVCVWAEFHLAAPATCSGHQGEHPVN